MIYSRFGDSAKKICRILTYPAALIVLAVSLFVVINGNYSPFIYFRF